MDKQHWLRYSIPGEGSSGWSWPWCAWAAPWVSPRGTWPGGRLSSASCRLIRWWKRACNTDRSILKLHCIPAEYVFLHFRMSLAKLNWIHCQKRAFPLVNHFFITVFDKKWKNVNELSQFRFEGDNKLYPHCNPEEDLLPQGMHIGSWHLFNSRKVVYNSRKCSICTTFLELKSFVTVPIPICILWGNRSSPCGYSVGKVRFRLQSEILITH